MELGAFSVSLAVKDIAASREFYEKLGFSVFGGDQTQRWLIMKNGSTLVGLFQGMFENNMLTFSPGWDSDAKPLESFTDVREIQRRLRAQGLVVSQAVD
jgi:catechol 2,3-dioxygenase-like lactoylglutathione lyase family enzyme